MSDKELRNYYQDRLITYFGGDIACKKLYHFIRVPTSFNCKKGAIKTELFDLNLSENKSFTKLNFINTSQTEIENYYKQKQSEKTSKMLATKRKNGTINKKPNLSSNNKKFKLPDKSNFENTEDISIISEPVINTIQTEQNKTMVKYNNNFIPGQHNLNLLKDLNNYYVRHNGILTHKRNTFCFLMANYARNIMSKDECIELCKKYFCESFYKELENVVEKVYKGHFYKFKYTYIARLLEFTDEDIRESYSCFSLQRKKEAIKNKAKKQCEKRKKKTIEYKNERYEYVKENIKEPIEFLAFACNCSQRTINRIKKEIRNNS